jgi:predicted dinucleotide-binding enzyme
MQIAIVGNGTMGRLLAAGLRQAGHQVRVTSRVAGEGLVSLSEATSSAEVVFLATPADAALTLPASALDGRVVVDLTNPLTADYLGLTVGHTDSSAERIARTYPRARVVKAFNTVFGPVLERGPQFGERRAQVFVASDDAAAKAQVLALATELRFEAVDAGVLKNARYLEPLAELMIQLAFALGRGTQLSPHMLSR